MGAQSGSSLVFRYLVNINGGIPFMKSIYSQRISRNVDIPSTGNNQ